MYWAKLSYFGGIDMILFSVLLIIIVREHGEELKYST